MQWTMLFWKKKNALNSRSEKNNNYFLIYVGIYYGSLNEWICLHYYIMYFCIYRNQNIHFIINIFILPYSKQCKFPSYQFLIILMNDIGFRKLYTLLLLFQLMKLLTCFYAATYNKNNGSLKFWCLFLNTQFALTSIILLIIKRAFMQKTVSQFLV